MSTIPFKVTCMITPVLYTVCINIIGLCMHVDIYQVYMQKSRYFYCSVPCSLDITKGSSLVVTHRTSDVRITSDRPGTT